jgi:hypothetical protein
MSHLHTSEISFPKAVHVFMLDNFDAIQLNLIHLLQKKSMCILKGYMSLCMLSFKSIHLFFL